MIQQCGRSKGEVGHGVMGARVQHTSDIRGLLPWKKSTSAGIRLLHLFMKPDSRKVPGFLLQFEIHFC